MITRKDAFLWRGKTYIGHRDMRDAIEDALCCEVNKMAGLSPRQKNDLMGFLSNRRSSLMPILRAFDELRDAERAL